jgi:hypothetical protein
MRHPTWCFVGGVELIHIPDEALKIGPLVHSPLVHRL